MVELADTIDSGSIVRKDMQVQVLLPAPEKAAEIDRFLSLFQLNSLTRAKLNKFS